MGVELIVSLLGGLALFLYGMQMISSNLEATAGNRLKDILGKLTGNRFLGVLIGAGITALVQSSSATTVMVLGFVNAGLMTLFQAVWIIMGANIGTTITGQLIALDIGAVAPLVAFIGVAMMIFIKNKKVQHIGGIFAGLGVLFIGMGMMSDAMKPLQDSEEFISLIMTFKNPLLGILAGALFTAVIQSSAASIGILQALAMSGLIGLDSAVYVLFGQNIGTCVTAVLASFGTNRNAKRTTVIHLMFNCIGTILFVIISMATPFVSWMESTAPGNAAAQIANVHTVFNIVTTILLLPFGQLLAKFSMRILPDRPSKERTDEDRWFEEITASSRLLGTSSIAINSLRDDMRKMLTLAKENVRLSFEAIERGDTSIYEQVEAQEEEIDLSNARLARRIARILTVEQSFNDIRTIHSFYRIIGNIERVGDHAMNLAGYAKHMETQGLSFSEDARRELGQMKALCMRAMEELLHESADMEQKILGKMLVLEDQFDDSCRSFRQGQLDRIQSGACNVETSILYSEILTDYERIGDHILNIAQAYAREEEHQVKA